MAPTSLYAGIAGFAALLLAGQAFAGASEPVVLIDPANPADSTISATVNEDEPGWNCLTMGNRICGASYVPADPEWSAEPDGTTHEDCLVEIADTSTVVCPDGYVAVS